LFSAPGIAYTTQVSFGPHRMHDVCGSLVAIAERAEPGNELLSSAEQPPYVATGGRT
jgi:hypothetical protein